MFMTRNSWHLNDVFKCSWSEIADILMTCLQTFITRNSWHAFKHSLPKIADILMTWLQTFITRNSGHSFKHSLQEIADILMTCLQTFITRNSWHSFKQSIPEIADILMTFKHSLPEIADISMTCPQTFITKNSWHVFKHSLPEIACVYVSMPVNQVSCISLTSVANMCSYRSTEQIFMDCSLIMGCWGGGEHTILPNDIQTTFDPSPPPQPSIGRYPKHLMVPIDTYEKCLTPILEIYKAFEQSNMLLYNYNRMNY